MRRSTGQVLRALRRGAALALALVAGWAAVRTAGLSDAGQALRLLAGDAAFAISLVHTQLPSRGGNGDGLTGWQRLVLAQSPLLHTAQGAVTLPAQAPAVPDQSEEDEAEDPIPVQQDSSVVARTLGPSASQSYLRAGDIYLADRAQKQPDAAALAKARVNITLGAGPQILILHSHGSEAYTPDGGDTYEASDPYRTTDCTQNVVRVGEEMAQVFRAHGFEVVHDTNLYDYPAYDGAYDRSLAAAERWLSQYPTIQIILDVHRDALAGEDDTIYKAVTRESGEQAAQVLLVVGTDGSGYHPLWQENLTFAMDLQQQMLDDYDTLARPMVLRSSRFNQHLSVGSVLVEVGTHGNTLQEALTGARLFAESAAQVLEGLKAP